MDGSVMADPDPDSSTLGLRHISSSLFNIPGFLVGFSTKGSLDSDAVRSPTSPLDLRVFANFSNPFTVRSPRSSSQSGCQKKWDCSKIGLGIVNLLADEIKPDGGDLDSPKRMNIVFGPQVKTKFPYSSRYSREYLGNSMKSNSLPRNYIISQLFQARKSSTKSADYFGNEEVPVEPKTDLGLSPSFISSSENLNMSSESFCSENATFSTNSSPLPIGRPLQVDNSLVSKPSSLPILLSHSMVSLSTHEIELSEDYTCIISHGPNPKTTHLFGDCILECHNNELTIFDRKAESGTNVPPPAKSRETSTLHLSDEYLSFCYTCKKKLEKEEEVYMHRFIQFVSAFNFYFWLHLYLMAETVFTSDSCRGEKAFCSFDCCTEIFADEEMEKTCNNSSSDSSPEQSNDEDVFLMAMDDRSINHNSWIAQHRV
ncbi:hypothetical protein CXB51_012609 [Gossypium anomalum]|uniref:FLZ-type domain-containing protein n=1 Tax=Gossypium anomalum TaxID=47600 RepID=A0A8J5Z5E0_9ROSI|nr:hypothetical protein CXB51_012609 [Gossypium anomalum]